MFRKSDDAVSPVIGVILMVAITVVLAAVVFVLVSDMGGGDNEEPPATSYSKDSQAAELTVIKVPGDEPLDWADMTVYGCDASGLSGTVSPGDTMVACTGNVRIVHEPSGSVIYQTDFP